MLPSWRGTASVVAEVADVEKDGGRKVDRRRRSPVSLQLLPVLLYDVLDEQLILSKARLQNHLQSHLLFIRHFGEGYLLFSFHNWLSLDWISFSQIFRDILGLKKMQNVFERNFLKFSIKKFHSKI